MSQSAPAARGPAPASGGGSRLGRFAARLTGPLGSWWRGSVIPGIDEAVRSMQPGAIRRVLVPVELGYPEDGFARIGPKPSTFSGERALDFVLSSKAMMDKTLMFDLKLVSVNGPSG